MWKLWLLIRKKLCISLINCTCISHSHVILSAVVSINRGSGILYLVTSLDWTWANIIWAPLVHCIYIYDKTYAERKTGQNISKQTAQEHAYNISLCIFMLQLHYNNNIIYLYLFSLYPLIFHVCRAIKPHISISVLPIHYNTSNVNPIISIHVYDLTEI